MMKLYGLGPTRSLRVRWALQELDADFEFVPINLLAGENRRPDFLSLNPAGKLPVLVDGDLVLTESAAIVMYLAENMVPKDSCPPIYQSGRRRIAGPLKPTLNGCTRAPKRRNGSPKPLQTFGLLPDGCSAVPCSHSEPSNAPYHHSF